LKFEAPIVLSVFQIYDAIWLRSVPIPKGSIDPQCVEKDRWIDGVPPAKAKQRCYAMLE
jgi:hypothetical protein